MADFYYRRGESVIGPLTGIELREAAFAGNLGPDTLVATSHDGPWVPARRVKGLYGQDGRPLPHPPEAQRIIERANALAVDLLPPPPIDADTPPQPAVQTSASPASMYQLTPPPQSIHQTSTLRSAPPSPVHRSRPSSRPRRRTNFDARPVVITLGVGVALVLVLLLAVVLNRRDDERTTPSEAAIAHAPSRTSKTVTQRPRQLEPLANPLDSSEWQVGDKPMSGDPASEPGLSTLGVDSTVESLTPARRVSDQPSTRGSVSESTPSTTDADTEWKHLNSDAELVALVERLKDRLSIQRVLYTGDIAGRGSNADCEVIFSEPDGDSGDPFLNQLLSNVDPEKQDVPTIVVTVCAYSSAMQAKAAKPGYPEGASYMSETYGRFVFEGPTKYVRQILNALR